MFIVKLNSLALGLDRLKRLFVVGFFFTCLFFEPEPSVNNQLWKFGRDSEVRR